MSHEFFHAWNVERIRPRSLEPFNFEDQNISPDLWLAEGFTNYYGPLILQRAGLTGIGRFAAEMGAAINTVLSAPGRQLRTAEEMSQMAAFVDAATAIDRTSFDNTFISYYTWGSAIALGLDLTLRVQTDHRVTLDDFMRALWQDFGKPGGRAVGYVDRPYTMADVRATLGRVMGDQRLADEFVTRYIQGHETVDYASLLAKAGLVWRAVAPMRASLGPLNLQDAARGVRIAAATAFGSPAYNAGLDRDDLIVAVDGVSMGDPTAVLQAVAAHRPGERMAIAYERRGERRTTTVTLAADPRGELIPVEDAGGTLTDAQRRFRAAWLDSPAGTPR
jgi:predicted metalloprotease with PDZ domain